MTREEAIKELRGFIGQLTEGCQEVIKVLVPELRESEDERHRKWILEYLYDGLQKSDEQFKDQFKSAISWLEKQKESLHISEMCKEKADSFTSKQKEQKPLITGNDFGWIDELKHDLKHPEELDQKVDDVLKQRKGIRTLEWSEEDREMKLKILKYLSTRCSVNEFEEVENWLNNLRPSWKPSEEQMEALHTAVYLEEMQFYGGLKDKLRDLYEQLKKL